MSEEFEQIVTEHGMLRVKAGPYASYIKGKGHSPARRRLFFRDGSHAVKGIKATHAWDIVSGGRFVAEQVDLDVVLKHGRKAGGYADRITGDSNTDD